MIRPAGEVTLRGATTGFDPWLVLRAAYGSLLRRPGELALLVVLGVGVDALAGLTMTRGDAVWVREGPLRVIVPLAQVVFGVAFWIARVRASLEPALQAPLSRSIWMTTRRLLTLAPLILACAVLAGPLLMVWATGLAGALLPTVSLLPDGLRPWAWTGLTPVLFLPGFILLYAFSQLLPLAASITQSQDWGGKELTRAARRVRWRLILVTLLACWLPWMLARAPYGLIDAFTFPVSLVPCFPVERVASAFAVMLWGGAYVWPEIFGIVPGSAESWLRSVLRLLAWAVAAGAAAETWRQLHASNSDS